MNRLWAFALLPTLLTSCGHSMYEFLLNRTDEEIEVVVHPPITKENYLKDKHRLIIHDTEFRTDSTTMMEYYKIQPEGWIYLGRTANHHSLYDISITYLEIRTVEDTMKYVSKHEIKDLFKKRKFIEYTFEKTKKKGENEEETKVKEITKKVGGETIVVK